MNTAGQTESQKNLQKMRSAAGAILVVAGAMLFLDQYLRTGWLRLLIMPGVGLYLYIWGARLRHLGLLVSGALVGGLGVGVGAAFSPAMPAQPFLLQIGNALLAFALGWVAILFGSTFFIRRTVWWAAVPGGVVGALGIWALFTPLRWTDLTLWLGLGIGLAPCPSRTALRDGRLQTRAGPQAVRLAGPESSSLGA